MYSVFPKMEKISTKGDSQTQQPVFMMPSFFTMHFFLSNFVFKALSTSLLYITKQCLTMFLIRKKDFGQIWAKFNVFPMYSLMKEWQLIKWLLHSVHKEISEANIINNSKMIRKFILRNNSYMMVKKEKQVCFFISSL